MTYINELKEGLNIKEIYYVKSKSIAKTKNGKDYFNVTLQDKTGVIDAKVWDVNSPTIREFNQGEFVKVEGSVLMFNGAKQFKVESVEVADVSEYDKNDYYLASKKNKDDLLQQFNDYIDEVKNKKLKKVLEIIFVEDTEFREKFLTHQGGKMVHHSFVSGLLEHTLGVTKIAKYVATSYEDINIDLVITSALLHDIGKVYEISAIPQNEYTDEGHLLGHIMIGYDIVSKAISKVGTFTDIERNELLHCILSHHGQLDFGSPKLPSIVEALIVSAADNLDAKIEIFKENIENFKANKSNADFQFTSYNKFLETNIRETSQEEMN